MAPSFPPSIRRELLLRNLPLRGALLRALREFFWEEGFLEVETPIACASPGVEVHLTPFRLEGPGLRHESRWLTTSPEFHMKRLLAAGMDRIFQVTRAFRAGERGDRHNPEFTIIEWYRVGVDYRAIQDDCERLVQHLARALGIRESPEIPSVRAPLILEGPWPRTSFQEAFRRAGAPDPFPLDPEARDLLLVERVEPTLGRDRPEFLVEYPADQASLARLSDRDPRVAERFELYGAGLELANGFTEVLDADEYLRRCREDLEARRALGLVEPPVDMRYVEALRSGLPPCAGVALGFDRVAMLLLGAARIDEVLAFPFEDA